MRVVSDLKGAGDVDPAASQKAFNAEESFAGTSWKVWQAEEVTNGGCSFSIVPCCEPHTAAAPAWRLTGAQQSGCGRTHWYALFSPSATLSALTGHKVEGFQYCVSVWVAVCVRVSEFECLISSPVLQEVPWSDSPGVFCWRSAIWFLPFYTLFTHRLFFVFNLFFTFMSVFFQTLFLSSVSPVLVPSS